MANCMICREAVTSGFVLCSQCAQKLKPYTLTPELAYFIDQLAEEIVLSEDIPSCQMCAIRTCQGQVSGLTCRNAVKAWLLSRAKAYLTSQPEGGSHGRCA